LGDIREHLLVQEQLGHQEFETLDLGLPFADLPPFIYLDW
jgi:hypothetical protein